MSTSAQTLNTLGALALYRWQVLPGVWAELERWQARAASMPEGALRETALGALSEKRANPEATAVFAILAPREHRAAALRAMTALQVAIDYLDSLSEEGGEDPLANGLALHGALLDAVSPGAGCSEWYRLHPDREDGGYLADLVGACRAELVGLPASERTWEALRRAARRCGEGQSQSHVTGEGTERLREWASEQGGGSGYRWWELAAGASSSVAAHALIAAAAEPATTSEHAELIDAAYFPSIGALTVLLDHLVDREADLAAGEHNYLRYYRSGEEAAGRVALLAARARTALAELARRRRHGAILSGVAGFYLGAVDAADPYAGPVRERLLESLGPDVRLIMMVTGSRHHG